MSHFKFISIKIFYPFEALLNVFCTFNRLFSPLNALFQAQNPYQNSSQKSRHYFIPITYVNNQLCYLSASKIINKEGKPEFQIIISFCKPEIAQKTYKERWQIETAFSAMKTSGFNLEDTHLVDIERIEKLVALVTVAFCWAYLVGIYLHDHDKPIKILNNGKRRKSFFKYGLTFIATVLLNAEFQSNTDIFKFLSCT